MILIFINIIHSFIIITVFHLLGALLLQFILCLMFIPPTVLAVRVSRCRIHESSQDFKIPNFGGLASPTPPLPCHSRSVGEDCGWAVPKAGSKVALHAPPHHLCHSRSVGEECGWAAPKAARVVPPHAPPPDPCHCSVRWARSVARSDGQAT